MRFKFFFLLQKNEGNSDNKNHHDVLEVIPLNNAYSFLTAS